MKLKILGTAPGKSLLDKSHTSYLLELDKALFLIDCGEGTTQKLLKLGLMENQIDAIIISHLHPDHFSGIFNLIQSLYLYKRTKDLYLYLPESSESIKNFFSTLYMFQERYKFKLIIQEYDRSSFEEFGIYPSLNNHLVGYRNIIDSHKYTNSMKAYSFIIKQKNRKMLLSCDINSMKDIEMLIPTCDVIILDGIHPSRESIINLANEGKYSIYITHGDYDEFMNKFKDILSINTRLVKENEEIIL